MDIMKAPIGTMVVALEDLDPKGGNVRKGDVGIVFGVTNCYNDNCGPIVRWFRNGKQAGVCNVYPGIVEIIFNPRNHDWIPG